MSRKQLPLVSALAWIIGSAVVIVGGTYSGVKSYWRHQDARLLDPSCSLTAIIQTGPEKEALKSDYLAELLELSVDQPVAIAEFDLQLAREKLLASPVIKEAVLKLLPPSTLYIDYVTRKPIARLADYDNTAFDEEGHFFPLHPFFPPKNLVEVYFGLPAFGQPPLLDWEAPLKGERFALALQLLHLLESGGGEEIHARRIDLSQAFAESCGLREIVLVCEEMVEGALQTRLLRLSTKNYAKALGNYLNLREELIESERGGKSSKKVIDLRLSKIGFIETH